MLRTLLLAGLLACLAGCTSFKAVENTGDEPAAVARAVEPGDRVRITTTTGWKLELDVTAVGPESISGTKPGEPDDPVEIPVNEIAEIKVKEVDAVKTGAVVVGSGLVMYWILGAVAAALVLGGA